MLLPPALQVLGIIGSGGQQAIPVLPTTRSTTCATSHAGTGVMRKTALRNGAVLSFLDLQEYLASVIRGTPPCSTTEP